MKLFYIENTVNERGNRTIRGYFSTIPKAQEALKDCFDWYRPNGTGEIYQVDTDALNPTRVLVCKDGKLMTNTPDLTSQPTNTSEYNRELTGDLVTKDRMMNILNGVLKEQFDYVPLYKVQKIADKLIEIGTVLPPYKTFKECYLQGECDISALDDFVEQWHAGKAGQGLYLQEFLGFTDEEFEFMRKNSNEDLGEFLKKNGMCGDVDKLISNATQTCEEVNNNVVGKNDIEKEME